MASPSTAAGPGVRFEPDEKPPWPIAAGLALQYCILALGGVVLTVAIVFRSAETSESYLAWGAFGALLVCGVATIVQVRRFGVAGFGIRAHDGHVGGLHGGVGRGPATGWPGTAGHTRDHLGAFPVPPRGAPLPAQAHPHADGGRDRDHADRGQRDAVSLRLPGQRPGRQRSPRRAGHGAHDACRHAGGHAALHGAGASLGSADRDRGRVHCRVVLRPYRRSARGRGGGGRGAGGGGGRVSASTSVPPSGRSCPPTPS